jgi:hypothetical protein
MIKSDVKIKCDKYLGIEEVYIYLFTQYTSKA